MKSDPDQAEKLPADGSDLANLRLLQLADSALPIGAMAHSFGLETLTSAEALTTANLPDFLHDYLEEAGTMEAAFCREAFHLSCDATENFSPKRWLDLNDLLSALKPARESRAGSAALGRNFLNAAAALGDFRVIHAALQATREAAHQQQLNQPPAVIHHAIAFGLASGALGFPEDRAILAFLHQSATSLVSACQRLLPLGQSQATRILWELKPAIIEAAARSATASANLNSVCCFTPLLDWGAMEHPALATRLFIS